MVLPSWAGDLPGRRDRHESPHPTVKSWTAKTATTTMALSLEKMPIAAASPIAASHAALRAPVEPTAFR